tara:strand:+ start:2101 stop:2826 length:726 start_codon:yes stop_codon:yes gene_type:complete
LDTNKKVIYFLKKQEVLIMAIRFVLYLLFLIIICFNSYSNVLYEKNNLIITDIDIKIYKKLYKENYGNDIDQQNAIKDLVLIQNVIENLEQNNSLFIEKIDAELFLQFSREILEDQNVINFFRFSKIRDEFIINYFKNRLSASEIENEFKRLDSLKLPISLNNCLVIKEVIDLKDNKEFINSFISNLKNSTKKFQVTINGIRHEVCLDNLTFNAIEQFIIKYIQTQTKEEFESFVYEKTKN